MPCLHFAILHFAACLLHRAPQANNVPWLIAVLLRITCTLSLATKASGWNLETAANLCFSDSLLDVPASRDVPLPRNSSSSKRSYVVAHHPSPRHRSTIAALKLLPPPNCCHTTTAHFLFFLPCRPHPLPSLFPLPRFLSSISFLSTISSPNPILPVNAVVAARSETDHVFYEEDSVRAPIAPKRDILVGPGSGIIPSKPLPSIVINCSYVFVISVWPRFRRSPTPFHSCRPMRYRQKST